MYKKFLNDCPVCNHNRSQMLLKLDCGNFDNSPLYETVRVKSCEKCGHIYNDLSKEEYTGLLKYYNEEYAPININSGDKEGDRPGSYNSYTMMRYSQLIAQIGKFIDYKSKILDVGCAGGGFLSFLQKRGYSNLFGIDFTEKYIMEAGKNSKFILKPGSAEQIPFENKSFDIIIIDQVVEHLLNPRKFFQEAKRILKDKGLVFVGIPDSSKYNEYYIFDFYWFLLREHIQHFDLPHLTRLAESEGFELVEYTHNESPMMSNTMILPNLNAVFAYNGKAANDYFLDKGSNKDLNTLIYRTSDYIKQENSTFGARSQRVELVAKSGRPVYIWGIGREFLFLYTNASLNNCKIITLLDSNLYKQSACTVSGMKINDVSMLQSVSARDAFLAITAFGHSGKIKQAAAKMGFNGEFADI